ncbi:hypothetical protein SAMN04487904_109182, partial [Actinopolyspora lacussalsi subsp. righensis]
MSASSGCSGADAGSGEAAETAGAVFTVVGLVGCGTAGGDSGVGVSDGTTGAGGSSRNRCGCSSGSHSGQPINS